MNANIETLIHDVEYAGMEYAQAATDATDAGHEHGDSSPQARDAYKHYANWRSIFKDACNSLRFALDIPAARPDVEAYQPTAED